MSRQVRLFRAIVRALFPEDFRVDYESEMTSTFGAQQREARSTGAAALVRLWWDTVVGLVRTAPREHVAQLRQDVAYAVRMMRRTPSFTTVAVLTLATGIGANTAIFSAVDAVLLRDLPYRDTRSLAMVWNHWPGTEKGGLSFPEFLDFRERLRSVEVAAWGNGVANLISQAEPERLRVAEVSPNLLDVLGVRPVLGRNFTPNEERRGEGFVAILGDELWRRRFNAAPGIVGQSIVLDGRPFTVVGVLPAGFVLPHDYGSVERSALIAPLTVDVSAPRNERGSHFLYSAARLRPGYSLEQAQSELHTLSRSWTTEFDGEYHASYFAALLPIRTEIVGDIRPALLVLFGAVSLVLLIACANVANLLLARGQVRAREIAVRKAVGASQARLARQVITEALVLAAAAACVGVLLARWLTVAMVRTAPGIPRLDELRLDPTVLAFTAAVSILTAVVFGSLPALEHARRDVSANLQGDRAARTPMRRAVRATLVAAQVALALVLLIGAGLLIQSFSRLTRVPAGINPDHVLTMRVSIPVDGYEERERAVGFYEQLLDRFRAVPGVRFAGAVTNLPLGNPIGDWDFYLPGETPGPHGSDRPADWQVVTPGYFEAMGVPLLRGRLPVAADRADAPPVVVINETLARTYFSGRDPIGQQIRMSGDDRSWMTIVGIVADVRHEGLDTPANSQVYLPHAQFKPFWRDTTVRTFALVVRTDGDPQAAASALRASVRAINPNVPVAQAMTMEQVVDRSVAPRRLQTQLLAVFAAVALVLAIVGTYGVLAYQITERTREFGVRMAVGAGRADILRMVVRQGMAPAAAGVLIGLGGAALLTQLLTSLLFETRPLDPVTFAGTAAVLLVAALAACLVPARRATRVDPAVALRTE